MLTQLQPLTPDELLAGATAVYEVEVPPEVLHPSPEGQPAAPREEGPRLVQLRPLTIGTFQLIMRAARDDAGMIPLLMIKESLVTPRLSLEQVRQLHLGMVNFLIAHIREISGLTGKKKSPS